MGTNLPTILPSTFLFHLLNPSSISYSRRYLPSHLSYPTFPPSYHFRRCLPPGSSIVVYNPIQQQPVVYNPIQQQPRGVQPHPAAARGVQPHPAAARGVQPQPYSFVCCLSFPVDVSVPPSLRM